MDSEFLDSRTAAHSSSTSRTSENDRENSNGSLGESNVAVNVGCMHASSTPTQLNSSAVDAENTECCTASTDSASLSAPVSVDRSVPLADVEAIEDVVSPRPRWRRVREDGQDFYINETTDEKWIPAIDDRGQTYYYEAGSRVSVWTLEDFDSFVDEFISQACSPDVGSPNTENAADNASFSTVISNFSPTDRLCDPAGFTDSQKEKRTSGYKPQNAAFRLSHHRPLTRLFSDTQSLESPQSVSDYVIRKLPSDGERFAHNRIVAAHISGPLENRLAHFERRGIVNRTKYIENNVRVHKRWGECLLILSGPWLFFRKKTGIQQGRLEFKLHVQKIDFSDPTEEVTSRKNALKLEEKDERGVLNVYLIQTPDAKLMNCWKTAIAYAKQLLNNEDRLTASLAKGTLKKFFRTPSKLDSSLTSRLRDFFRSRPTAESLRSRGILKNEPVFASTLVQICENEHSEVPRFIVCVIRAIEARGLHHLGIYRVSANAADVQKLRCCVNQYNYSLNSEKWTLEVLTSSLKLFFRELREPLFTFSAFSKIRQLFASDVSDSEMVSRLNDIIQSMPIPHIATARVLFHHLYRVTQHCDCNQMHPYKLALIFGPGLLRPEDDSVHMSTVTKLQAPFVNFSIQHVTELFGPIVPPPVVA